MWKKKWLWLPKSMSHYKWRWWPIYHESLGTMVKTKTCTLWVRLLLETPTLAYWVGVMVLTCIFFKKECKRYHHIFYKFYLNHCRNYVDFFQKNLKLINWIEKRKQGNRAFYFSLKLFQTEISSEVSVRKKYNRIPELVCY